MHPSQKFDRGALSPATQRGLDRAAKEAHRIISINRYWLGYRTRGIVYGADGSLTVVIQHDAPTDPAERANWLPAPDGPFYLAIRHYSPKAAIITGDWMPPPVQKR